MTSIVLYRSGGLNLTRRWEGTRVKDVGDWAGQPDRVIEMVQGLSLTPVTLRVRRFIPRDGDVLVRRWVDNGVSKSQELPPYALADAQQTANEFRDYLRDHAVDGLKEAVKESDDLIRQTYDMVFSHYSSLPVCIHPWPGLPHHLCLTYSHRRTKWRIKGPRRRNSTRRRNSWQI